MDKQQIYTLGFAFSKNAKDVVLIRKEKPEWQRGFFNGVGGKYEEDDSSLHSCMVREFEEETNVLIESWWDVCTMYNDEFKVNVYSVFTDDIYSCISNENEAVKIININNFQNHKILYNLNWLIPMAKDPQIINEMHHNYYLIKTD